MKRTNVIPMGLFALGLAFLLLMMAGISQARAAGQSSQKSRDVSEMMCTISDHQLEDAMKAFEKMMPTFQHPRCANCHGGVNPFQANTDHAGGKFDVVLGPEGDLMYDATFAGCQGCHSGLKGWEVPPADLAFVGKDAVELCKQMKTGNADDFMDHITRDRGKTPFIETGFTGMRGLGEAGIEYYEALNDKKPTPEPPPGSHSALIDQAKAWVEALGGEFPGDTSCGCEPQQYALQVDESLMGAFQQNGSKLEWKGSSTVQIPIKFNDDGTFTGEATSQRKIDATLTSKISCSGTATPEVKWQVNGKLVKVEDPNDPLADPRSVLQFSVRFTPSPASVDCGLPVPLPLPIDDTERADSPLKQVELDAFIGETKSAELKTNVSGSEVLDNFKITIIKLK